MKLPAVLALLALAIAAVCHALDGVPVLFEGSLVGCADQLEDVVRELTSLFGERAVYFFGVKGCPECAEMERYLRRFVPEEELAYVDVSEHRGLFLRLLRFLSMYVEERYLSEVPIVVVRFNGSAVLVSIGQFYDDFYWGRVLLGDVPERCQARPLAAGGRGLVWTLAWSLVLGLASALSPCVLYLYVTLLLSYAPYGGSSRRLIPFVLGLGLGYLAVVVGLYGVVRFLRPLAWAFFVAFGVYMILHAKGVLGCPIGGRACRDVSYYSGVSTATLLGGFFPFLLGLVASVSATPCSAGYFVLLQAAAGDEAGLPAASLIFAYLAAYVAPYVLLSLLSSRLVSTVSKLLNKITAVELAGGIVLVVVGLYLALSPQLG